MEDKIKLQDLAKMLLEEQGQEKETLLELIKAYPISEDKEQLDRIIDEYAKKKEEGYLENYRDNLAKLQNYPYYYKENLDCFPIGKVIWYDKSDLIYRNENGEIIHEIRKSILEEPKKNIFLCINIFWNEFLIEIKEIYYFSSYNRKLPIYAVYDEFEWKIFLQIIDIDELLEKERFVFLIGTETFKEYWNKGYPYWPTKIVKTKQKNEIYAELIEEQAKKIEEIYNTKKRHSLEYYKSHADLIREHIANKKPKILFVSSRYTTALQYHARDCQIAAMKMQLETEFEMELDVLHRQENLHVMLDKFKPDILFIFDHFRIECEDVPEELAVITWIQDPLPVIMDPKTPAKLLKRDFILTHYTTWKKFRDLSYPKEQMMDAPIPASQYIYHPYILTEKEKQDYSSDICLICHNVDAEYCIQVKVPEIREIISMLYNDYWEYTYQTGNVLFRESEFIQYINDFIKRKFQVDFLASSPQELKEIAFDMYISFNQCVYRRNLADWLIDAGFTNIKLWGNGWLAIEKYKKYAMGPAQNGEMLSKICQASKIVLGNNVMITACARAWETMLSGGFYMSNYVPEDEDGVDIRKIVEVEKDVVMFYDRDDLIEKVHYYLEHEQERQEMIERGRKAALEKMTYDILMKRTIDTIGERFKKEI